MTKHDLKEMRNLGAELGAAKAEVERLRDALRPFAVFEAVRSKQGGCTPKSGTVWAVASISEEAEITAEHLQAAVSALSQQPEPSDTFTAVDMATAAAQGFRDGQAAVEPAPAQDEREAVAAALASADWPNVSIGNKALIMRAICLLSSPAQTEQQPVGYQFQDREGVWKQFMSEKHYEDTLADGTWPIRAIYAAPIAQTAPLKPHQLRELVNDLRDVARKYHATEQLREQIANTLSAALSAQGAGDANS